MEVFQRAMIAIQDDRAPSEGKELQFLYKVAKHAYLDVKKRTTKEQKAVGLYLEHRSVDQTSHEPIDSTTPHPDRYASASFLLDFLSRVPNAVRPIASLVVSGVSWHKATQRLGLNTRDRDGFRIEAKRTLASMLHHEPELHIGLEDTFEHQPEYHPTFDSSDLEGSADRFFSTHYALVFFSAFHSLEDSTQAHEHANRFLDDIANSIRDGQLQPLSEITSVLVPNLRQGIRGSYTGGNISSTGLQQLLVLPSPDGNAYTTNSHIDSEAVSALQRMTVKNAEVWILYNVHGFTKSEIELIIQRTAPTVSTRLREGTNEFARHYTSTPVLV